jgi:hemerythrin
MGIEKIKVSDGIYWVEIKDKNLKILCASPADSIKHLIKNGFNKTLEQNGYSYESGPNAILLSDIPIQNGQLSNLSEFPILQMFYRQGMLIPNHHNSNQKPLLIGTSQQILSQTNYIYRGNYGLVTQEEIEDAIGNKEKAKELLKLKLKFAFGKITNPNKLIDTISVDNTNRVEIKEDVFIQRKDCNLFEISYKDESIEVNLNLNSRQKYNSPYQLGYFDIKREFFAVIHSGQGDGWNTSQPSMSSVLMYQGKIYLIDAGPNTENMLEALGIGISEIEGIFHTHAHDDHFAGLANLIKSDKKIKYFATKLVRDSVVKKFSALLNIEEFYFEHYFDVIDLKLDSWNNINGLEIKPMLSPHPVETNIFIFRTLWKESYKSYAHFADLTSLDILNSMASDNDEENGISLEFLEKVKQNYLEYADVKKVDIGGGMIHGESKDFKNDPSKKIILAHTSGEFSTQDKEIGSTASFGTLDVLIPANIDYDIKDAYTYLSKYHKELPSYIIDSFTNLDIVKFNPGTIIQKKNENIKYIYVVLSGIAEAIYTNNRQSTITSGNIIGRISGLLNMPSTETVRSISYVTALKIPAKMLLQVIRDNMLYANLEQKMDKMLFLKKTKLFNEDITYPILDNITENMIYKSFSSGSKFTQVDDGNLYIVASGTLSVKLGDKEIKTLSKGDFFGEESSIFDTESAFCIEAITNVSFYLINSDILKNIPIVKWKLFEELRKKEEIILGHTDRLNWSHMLKVGVQVMDIQLEKIFILINSLDATANIADEIERKSKAIAIATALVEYTKYHTKSEESLLSKYRYPKLDSHKESHIKLIENLEIFLDRLKNSDNLVSKESISEFYELIVKHIKEKDKEYAIFLNSKGIY